ncbi:MAG: hypothetical protein JWM80_4066, partial [Cyanobacteria bacterium RYN_339]|nr:hypothetical protein [Cyanobacteria bacterium RYN_339]
RALTGYNNQVMRGLVSVCLGACLLAACSQAARVAAPVTTKSKAVSPKAEETATPTPRPSAVATTVPALDASRRSSLLDALTNAAAASRAARISSTMGDISGVLSNNAAGLIANNAGNLISDHGTGYALLATATPTPGPTVEPFKPEHFTTETASLVYQIDTDSPSTGGFKSYDKQGFKAGKLAEALVDDFSFTDVKNLQAYKGHADQLAVEHHLRRNSSKRLPFGDTLISREIFRLALNAAGDGVDTTTIGWEIEFSLAVALAGGEADSASFEAVAGETDLTVLPRSDGATLVLPTVLALTGKNARGTYVGTLHNKDGALDVQVTHTATAGGTTELTIATRVDGATRQVVGVPAAHLRLTADIDAHQGGMGLLEDTTGATPFKLGDVAWDVDGIATITFADGGTLKARLF